MDKQNFEDSYSAIEDTMGGRMCRAREAANLTVEDAAGRVGVLVKTWNTWERDRDVPRANKLTTMAGILGVSPVWLLSGTGGGPSESTGAVQEEAIIAAFENTKLQVMALNSKLDDIASALGKLSKPQR